MPTSTFMIMATDAGRTRIRILMKGLMTSATVQVMRMRSATDMRMITITARTRPASASIG